VPDPTLPTTTHKDDEGHDTDERTRSADEGTAKSLPGVPDVTGTITACGVTRSACSTTPRPTAKQDPEPAHEIPLKVDVSGGTTVGEPV
jgi:hypothetical protein